MYSLMPKVNTPDSHSSGSSTTRRKIESSLIDSAREGVGSLSSGHSLPSTKSKAGLMGRVFGGAKPKDSRSTDFDSNEVFATDPAATLLTGPATFLEPLKHKLVARPEPSPRLAHVGRERGPARSTKINFWPQLRSSQSMTRHQETLCFARLDLYNDLPGPEHRVCSRLTNSAGESVEANIEYIVDHQAGDIANVFGTDPLSIQSWMEYLRNYSEGKLNLNNPPLKPTACPGFTHLPAVLPSTEQERMASSKMFDIIWPNFVDNNKGGPTEMLMLSAMKHFDVPNAAVSFFTEDHEIFRAAVWWTHDRIYRENSIAAHGLLGVEVFVILDTTKDWRFVDHPYVVGPPKYRFFAGAPLLSKDGQPVGIFSIWSDKPRSVFTPFDRRELACFADLAMRNLQNEADKMNDPDLRSTPLLDRDSVINGDYKPKQHSRHREPVDPSLSPAPLRLSSPEQSPSVFKDQAGRHLTPPPSADSNHQSFFGNSTGGFGRNHKDLVVDSSLNMFNEYSAYQELITPDSDDFEAHSSRPYSGSDITSINWHPPNTPHTSLISSETNPPSLVLKHHESQDLGSLTIDDFNSLSYDDVAEDPSFIYMAEEVQPMPASPALDTASVKSASHDNAATPRQHAGEFSAAEKWNRESMTLPLPDRFDTIPADVCGYTPIKRDPNHSLIREWAKKLRYSRMYVIQLEATNPHIIDEDSLCAQGGLKTQIVAAYNFTETRHFDLKQHLRAIRTRGVVDYTCRDRESKWKKVLLYAIHTQSGPVSQRNSGLVLAAFRRSSKDQPSGIAEIESTGFKEAAEAIATVLLKEEDQQLSNSSRQKAEITGSTRYPANEAVEVGNNITRHSFECEQWTLNSLNNQDYEFDDHQSSFQSKPFVDERHLNHSSQSRLDRASLLKQYPDIRLSRQKNINSENSLSFTTGSPVLQLSHHNIVPSLRYPSRHVGNLIIGDHNNSQRLHHELGHDLAKEPNDISGFTRLEIGKRESFRTPSRSSSRNSSRMKVYNRSLNLDDGKIGLYES